MCSCPPGHSGNPLTICLKGECSDHSECRSNQACRNNNCENPCAGACGTNANCEVSFPVIITVLFLMSIIFLLKVRNHVPVCSCPARYAGDPFSNCRQMDPGKKNYLHIRTSSYVT